MTTVLDATVLLNFGRCAALWLVERSFPSPVIVVQEVVAEIRYPPVAVGELRAALAAGWLTSYSLSAKAEIDWTGKLQGLTSRLGSGEVASLAACLANGWAIATDDRDARRIATDQGITLTGTIGVLVGAVEAAVILGSLAEALFQRMLAEGFRAPISRLAELLDD